MMLRNTIWNLLGEGLPMAAALLSIPLLVGGIGIERFGALTLVWALLGYLMVLDLGLARSLIQIIAGRRGRERRGMGAIVVPAFWLMGLVGGVAGLAVAALSGPIAAHLVSDSTVDASEIRDSLLIVAAVVPTALVSAGLRGVLEAHQEFRRVNLVKMAVGVLNYLTPLCVLPFSDSLFPVLAAIAAGRLLGLVAYAWLCAVRTPEAFRIVGRRESLRPLFTMGAWTMLNNMLGPLMTYADRFVLASLVPVGAVAFYTTPFEVVVRLLFIPAALSGVLFPAAAGLFRRDPVALGRILELGGFAMLLVFLTVQGAAVLLGGPALDLWLGAEFARESAPILSVLALGLLFNAVAYVPYALIHGIGRMDVTARLQLVEAPVYFAVLWVMIGTFGTMGAAMAWTVRTGCDLLLLLALLSRLTPGCDGAARRLGAVVVAVGGCVGGGLAWGGGMALVPAGLLLGGAVAAHRLLALRRAVPETVPAERPGRPDEVPAAPARRPVTVD